MVNSAGGLTCLGPKTSKMDFQHRAGAKTGGGGVASSSESSRDRKERLRKLALETIDLAKVGVHLLEFL